MLKAIPEGGKELRREQVGSTVSKELIISAIWAVVFTNLAIFAYVWFRFEWQFAIGAIVSLIHDVMFTIGVFAFFRLDFDLTIVAALLTILGYSINDTVVIYDRIRENLRRYKRMPLGELLDLSVNETMSRTIMTVGTVFMALLALYFFGGEVIRGFTFAMLFGVLVGTYSSVFIAAPFLILIGVKRRTGAPIRPRWRRAPPPRPRKRSLCQRRTLTRTGWTIRQGTPRRLRHRRRHWPLSLPGKAAGKGRLRDAPRVRLADAPRNAAKLTVVYWVVSPPHPVLLPCKLAKASLTSKNPHPQADAEGKGPRSFFSESNSGVLSPLGERRQSEEFPGA